MKRIDRLKNDIAALAKSIIKVFDENSERFVKLKEKSDPSDFEAVDKTFKILWTEFQPELTQLMKEDIEISAKHYEVLKNATDKSWAEYAKMRMHALLKAQHKVMQKILNAQAAKGEGSQKVMVMPSVVMMAINGESPFSAVLHDHDGKTIQDQGFTWHSSSTAVASIDTNGVARAISAGDADIIATETGTKLVGAGKVTVI